MEITEAQSQDAFTALREEWDSLVTRCGRATIFQTWEWNEAWWQAYAGGKRLLLLQVRDRGELVGIAPLYVARYPGTPLRRLRFLGTGVTDYLDILAPDDRAPEVCAAILNHLAQSKAYDLVDWHELRPSAVLREAVQHYPETVSAGYRVVWSAQEPCLAVALPATWEDYVAQLGKLTRRKLAYYKRLVHRRFEKVEMRLAEPEELNATMTALFDLHGKRWRTRDLPGHLASSQSQVFHRRVAEQFHARGWLRPHITYLGGRAVAVEHAFCFRQRYYLYLAGMDPEWYKYSLGTVLMGEAIRHAIEEGCVEVDFLRGKEPYKLAWMPTEEHLNHRLVLVRPASIRSRAALWVDELRTHFDTVRIMQRRLRHAWRRASDHIVRSGVERPDHEQLP